MQRKAKVVLEGRLKEANHLRHLDNVRSEKIEAPNMNTKGGPVARGEGMTKKGLDRLGPTTSAFCTVAPK